MLFSNPEVSRFVRDNFLASWESVRPVPIVEIDFRNGRTLKRTVNGNIATYICAPDGRVLDIIPGLNSPKAYLEDLRYGLNLHRASLRDFDRVVLDYHRTNCTAPTRYEMRIPDWSKAAIERPVKVALALDSKKQDVERASKAALSQEEAMLAADTELNRRERKPLLHQILAEKIVRPSEITKRVYKDALHCDLDDPYLGLVSSAFNGGGYEDR